jgi:hypothetical protein
MLIFLAEIIGMLQIGWRVPVIVGTNAVALKKLARGPVLLKCG